MRRPKASNMVDQKPRTLELARGNPITRILIAHDCGGGGPPGDTTLRALEGSSRERGKILHHTQLRSINCRPWLSLCKVKRIAWAFMGVQIRRSRKHSTRVSCHSEGPVSSSALTRTSWLFRAAATPIVSGR